MWNLKTKQMNKQQNRNGAIGSENKQGGCQRGRQLGEERNR